jgi:hypothetical protein
MMRTMMSRDPIRSSVLMYLNRYSFSEKEVTAMKNSAMKNSAMKCKHTCIFYFCTIVMLTLSPISETAEL